MTDTLSSLTQQLLDAALKAGADSADSLVMEGTSLSIDVRGGALEQAERSEGIDLGLRVLIGKKQACVSSSNSSAATITEMAQRAVAMANEAPEDANIGLADPDQITQSWDVDALELADDSPEPDPAALQEDACRAEAAALEFEGISQVQSASAGYGARRLHLAATNGFSGGYTRTSRAISCVAITGTGSEMERDYFGDSRVFQADVMDAAEIGKITAERTLARAGARKPPTGAFPVLYDERVSGSLISHLLDAANGASVARGASWLRDAMGEQVLPTSLSLTQDPHRPRVSGSRPFDAEGLATRRSAIVENGVLSHWILDLANARKLGLESTANAARGVSSPPHPSVTNAALTQGAHSQQELLAQMGTGLLVTSMIGASINANTGDYSRGASGFWVENGQIAYPVNECTIAGNLRDMLRSIVPANDARMHLSRPIPSLLVEGLTLAGE
ncbi:peptidase U62 modulator of DNA gyrase [Actibacterium atlanticum]|uniref:Peptidase U62 modulator of DNA gyrase n=1 Tax=Actibacterium atlanticum TaxID=1461693 RepID=A0A058ZNB3_9RHOB|nr:TldD/PmbA family protein [Actibacterium atlanticum]KCV82276.1 peptidase U62 modulator of DNA gyrase [Actibacterium atlanticum]